MEPYELTPEYFEKFRQLVYERVGISMSSSKVQLLKTRLQRRVRALGLPDFASYYNHMKSLSDGDPEMTEFINAVTTNKTDFFREAHHFDFAVGTAIPACLAAGQTTMKVWHAGCSTGEEPYTLAMAIREAGLDSRICVQQLSTDIDTQVLAHAEAGIYSEERVKTIPSNRLQKWFLRGKGPRAGHFRVRPELQESMTFRRLNLTSFPWPFKATTRFDIIFCRNVLIYFDQETQERVIESFFDRLTPNGYLFLGHSESLHNLLHRFESYGKTIYRARSETAERRNAA